MELEYVKNYEEYTRYWAEILAERKELKNLQHALIKANKRVDSANSKLESAEKTAEKRERTNSKGAYSRNGSKYNLKGSSTELKPEHKPEHKTEQEQEHKPERKPEHKPERKPHHRAAPPRPAPPSPRTSRTEVSDGTVKVTDPKDVAPGEAVVVKPAAAAADASAEAEAATSIAAKEAPSSEGSEAGSEPPQHPTPTITVNGDASTTNGTSTTQQPDLSSAPNVAAAVKEKDIPKLTRGKGTQIELAEVAVKAAEQERDAILQQVGDKLLETQKEIHVGLRKGFYVLW